MYLSHGHRQPVRVIREFVGFPKADSGIRRRVIKYKYRLTEARPPFHSHVFIYEFTEKPQPPATSPDHIIGFNAWLYKSEGNLATMERVFENIKKQFELISEREF